MSMLILAAAVVAIAATTGVLLDRDLRRAEERARWRQMRTDLGRIGRAFQDLGVRMADMTPAFKRMADALAAFGGEVRR